MDAKQEFDCKIDNSTKVNKSAKDSIPVICPNDSYS